MAVTELMMVGMGLNLPAYSEKKKYLNTLGYEMIIKYIVTVAMENC